MQVTVSVTVLTGSCTFALAWQSCLVVHQHTRSCLVPSKRLQPHWNVVRTQTTRCLCSFNSQLPASDSTASDMLIVHAHCGSTGHTTFLH